MLNCAMATTWTLLSPFYGTNIDLQDLVAAMLISYALFISGLVIYSYLRIRQAKLHNFYMSKVLLDQAYDIDNFKQVNDRFGHDVGDEVLKRVAQHIKASIVGHEFARLGGEEFVIFFHGLDQPAADRQVAALCRRVREDRGAHPVTISIGLARVDPADTLTRALVKADQALYEAKHNGKDRFVLWTAQQSEPTHPQAGES
ncbi:Diguanylate cyclase YdeH [compost metagenome]